MLSSTTPNYHEFYNTSCFQHFKKRPFDQNDFDIEQSADNIYKKFKPTPLESLNSLSFQQPTSCTTPSRSFRLGTNHSSSPDLSKLNHDEQNLLSDTPRIIDLSTGEYLELIPSVDQLQKNRKPKRPIDSVENQDELSNSLGIMEENKEDLINDSLLHSPKRIRTSKEHIELKTGYKANTADIPKKPQLSQSLLLHGHGKYPNIKFTVPYQKAITKYMRAQLQHLNNNMEYGNEGKELILYNPRNDGFKDYFVDSNDKIFETSKETMDLDLDGHNGDDEDQMDID
ncbi:641_t:CDS:2 [Rhizophagus irregularis]|nr:641_t:CDS:2 [Rhizophagus irregularis]